MRNSFTRRSGKKTAVKPGGRAAATVSSRVEVEAGQAWKHTPVISFYFKLHNTMKSVWKSDPPPLQFII